VVPLFLLKTWPPSTPGGGDALLVEVLGAPEKLMDQLVSTQVMEWVCSTLAVMLCMNYRPP